MRALMFLLPVVLMAQSTAPKAPAAKPTTAAPAAKAAPKTTAKPAAAPKASAPVLETDDQKTVYALGLQIYRSLGQFNLSPAEVEIVKSALGDAAAGVTKVGPWLPLPPDDEPLRSRTVIE